MSGKGDVVAAVDFGSYATRVLIGRRTPEGMFLITGYGQALSKECVHFGAIQNIQAAAKAFRKALDAARAMSGERIVSVYCGIQGDTVKSNLFEGKVQVENGLVKPEHLIQARKNAELGSVASGSRSIGCIVSEEWLLDNMPVMNPLNMRGNVLTGRLRYTQLSAFLENNLRQCIENEGLTVADFVFTPLAAAYGCLLPEDKKSGAAVVNLGATCSGIVVYQNGKVIEAGAYKWGCGDIINDVASVLRISFAEATELVMDYGINLDLYADENTPSSQASPSANDVTIKLSHTVTGAPTTIKKSVLDEIVFLRANELTDQICGTLNEKRLLYALPRGLVITGGGANINNLDRIIYLKSGVETRIGTPLGFQEIPDAIDAPEWTAVTGILTYGFAHRQATGGAPETANSLWAAIWHFIKEYIA